jgi:hypothetical protein
MSVEYLITIVVCFDTADCTVLIGVHAAPTAASTAAPTAVTSGRRLVDLSVVILNRATEHILDEVVTWKDGGG